MAQIHFPPVTRSGLKRSLSASHISIHDAQQNVSPPRMPKRRLLPAVHIAITLPPSSRRVTALSRDTSFRAFPVQSQSGEPPRGNQQAARQVHRHCHSEDSTREEIGIASPTD
ncbi:hypothetical protein J1614_007202 [Plenodomus biglobosus]|nr:hypothetical protein J1614_007202 [Plenodomus biglobosus]